MKRLLWITICLFCSLYAQTIITGPNVSGTWNLAGSPYIIQTQVTVAAADMLIIEPGVVIRFQPSTKLRINGQLIASGTSNAPITFQATDTTNWSNDTTPNGGWNGIHFHPYAGSGTDQSQLKYCIIEDGKYGYSFFQAYSNACTSERGLKISHCTFRHNRSGSGLYIAESPLRTATFLSNDTIEIKDCIFYNNASLQGVVQSSNGGGGFTRISGCHFYQNSIGSCINAHFNNLVIEANEIDHNTMLNSAAPINVALGNVIIRANRIHHNESEDYGGIACRAGRITIENNLVCNNRQTDPFCGITGGGAGINIAHNDGSDFMDTYYIVRNNIIANNHAGFGGGGLYVFNARAVISNNHIINNYSESFGNGLQVTNPNSEVYLKNNLFHSQYAPGNVDTTNVVYILSANKILFDNNTIPSSFSKSVNAASGYTLIGDTIHNVISTNPGIVNPTPDNSYLSDATIADFNLLSSSVCIDHGDTAGSFPAIIDYAENNRLVGIIDIGAYEYQAGKEPLEIEEENIASFTIYPNPAEINTGFNVILPEATGRIIIYDLTGRQIFHQPVTQQIQRLDFNPESKGIYLVHFYGRKTYTQKLIIH